MSEFLASGTDTGWDQAVAESTPCWSGHLNLILPESLRRHGEFGLPVNCHDHDTSSRIRNTLDSSQTHVRDALCLGNPVSIESLLYAMTMVSVTDHGG